MDNRSAANILNKALDAVWVIDQNDVIEYANPAAEELSGYSLAELRGRPLSFILPSPIAVQHAGFIRAYTQQGGESKVLGKVRELEIVTKGGEAVPVEFKAFEIEPVDGVRRFSGIMRDIRARKLVEEERSHIIDLLEELTRIDELTSLMNRRGFFEEAEKLVAYSQRHSRPATIAIMDLDHFKKVNDRLGHAVGDKVLREVARLCRKLVRPEDIFARYGGEEFALLLRDTEIEDATAPLERLRLSVANHPIEVDGDEAITVTVSIGAAPLRLDDTIGASLDQADRALYAAKNGGRNQVRLAKGPCAPAEPDRQAPARRA
ncbi:MAG: sensor domain-containing diguanylate cyclase [Alphaproteobacteria bacterium]